MPDGFGRVPVASEIAWRRQALARKLRLHAAFAKRFLIESAARELADNDVRKILAALQITRLARHKKEQARTTRLAR
jgi:hypothetical protein